LTYLSKPEKINRILLGPTPSQRNGSCENVPVKAPKLNGVHWVARLNFCLSCVISGFCRDLDEICALLGHYAAYTDNFLPTFREKPIGPLLDFLTL